MQWWALLAWVGLIANVVFWKFVVQPDLRETRQENKRLEASTREAERLIAEHKRTKEGEGQPRRRSPGEAC
jgi:hypothetical protein